MLQGLQSPAVRISGLHQQSLTRLTPNRSDRLWPASASKEAEFIHNPAKPLDRVRATLLPRPIEVLFLHFLDLGRRLTYPTKLSVSLCPSSLMIKLPWAVPRPPNDHGRVYEIAHVHGRDHGHVRAHAHVCVHIGDRVTWTCLTGSLWCDVEDQSVMRYTDVQQRFYPSACTGLSGNWLLLIFFWLLGGPKVAETSPTDGSVESRCVCSRGRAQAGERSTGTCPGLVLRGLRNREWSIRGRQKGNGMKWRWK